MPVALLDHDDTGVGQTVCLLHSGVTDRRMWAGLRSALPNGLRVIAADLRGFGGTPMPAPDISYTDAEDVASLLDAAGISAATVVGSSLGGRVALELATTRPDLVSSLSCSARGIAESIRRGPCWLSALRRTGFSMPETSMVPSLSTSTSGSRPTPQGRYGSPYG